MWSPSFEWSVGAGISTVVPLWKLPESILYSVVATPEPSSVGVSVTVTSADCGPVIGDGDVRQPDPLGNGCTLAGTRNLQLGRLAAVLELRAGIRCQRCAGNENP